MKVRLRFTYGTRTVAGLEDGCALTPRGGDGVDTRVLKKLLRAVLILKAYHPTKKLHLYFASPKVHKAVQQPLKETFAKLKKGYPKITWHLLINDDFTKNVVCPTLEKTRTVADTSELFVRAAKLLDLCGVESVDGVESVELA